MSFPLPYGPEDLDKAYNNELRIMGLSDMFGWVPAKRFDDGTVCGFTFWRRVQGIERWWPWLRFVGRMESNPRSGEVYREPLPVYTCIKHDPDTGDCTVYDQRPHFCRSYGRLEVPCDYPSEQCECGVIHRGEESHRLALEEEEREREKCCKLFADLKEEDVPTIAAVE